MDVINNKIPNTSGRTTSGADVTFSAPSDKLGNARKIKMKRTEHLISYIALIVGVVSVMASVYGALVSRGTAGQNESIVKILDELVETTTITKITANLSDEAWNFYLDRVKVDAARSEYLESHGKKLKLTPEGRTILDKGFLSKTIRRATASLDNDCNSNHVIRAVTVESLYSYSITHDVNVETLLAIVDVYVQEVCSDNN